MVLTITIAMALRILPLPPLLASMNPDWVLLAVLYWSLVLPDRFGVGNAWLVGLLTDILTGRILGQHAFVYAIVAYICVRFYLRLRVFPMTQQMAFVFLCLLLSRFLLFWFEALHSHPHLNWQYWLPALTGVLGWPIILAIGSRPRQNSWSYK